MVDNNWKMLLIEEYVSISEKYKCEKMWILESVK